MTLWDVVEEAQAKTRAARRERRKKVKEQRIIKEKFAEEREGFLKPVVAKTEKQRQYFRALNDPNVHVVVALGFHGSGKSYVSAVTAADKFRKGEIDKIIVARPYVQTGKTSGFKPGTSLEKLYPYVRNILDTVKERIGVGAYEVALKDGLTGQIEVQEVESIRGRSFDEPSFLIIDESQQTTPDEMKSIVTRISDKCKLVLAGDVRQKDIQGQSGMEWFIDFVERHNIKGVEIIDFCDPEDIVRGGFVKEIAVGLMKDNVK
jgi:phosphate starvation-inducible PhoH-like protein